MNILLVRVIENKKYSGGKFSLCDILLSPPLNDPNFDKIKKEDWVWTSRYFEYPLFNKIKSGIFLISLKDDSGLEISIYKDIELQKKAQIGWDGHQEYWKRWEELGKRLNDSGIFKPLDGPIEL